MPMKSTAFVLKKPYEFIEEERETNDIEGWATVKPSLISICAADLRYYTGYRRTEALRQKLPMTLIHEGIGKVVRPAGDFQAGDRAVIIPAIPGYIHSPQKYPTKKDCCAGCADETIGENHCLHIRFLSSGCDGICRSLVQHPPECLAGISDDVPDETAVMSELLTVACNAVKNAEFSPGGKIAIFGDGPVSYLMACVLHYVKGVPKENLHVFGMIDEKLSHFTFATTHNVNEEPPSENYFSYAFECVGGIYSQDVIESAMNALDLGGKLFLIGVSELEIPVNTRAVLEKRLTITGVSRSPRQDYPVVLEHLRDKDFQQAVSKVIHPEIFEVNDVESLKRAFDFAATKDYWGKILLRINVSRTHN